VRQTQDNATSAK